MAMILDAFMSKFSTLLADFVYEEVIKVLGVKEELQELRRRMRSIQCLLKDAEKKKFGESSTELWLSELKDVMYDAEDIIDLCRIEGAQLLADHNPESRTSSVCCDFSSAFSCFTSVPLRHEIGNRIEEINNRLNKIYEGRKHFKLEKSTISETPEITVVDSRQTSSMVDPFAVGREVEVAANNLVEHFIGEKVDEKCLLFAVTGMGGIGKTTLAQKIFNHPKIKTFFNLEPVWVCVSQTYSEIELLKQVIRGVKGSYGDANTKSELQTILSNSISLGHSLFLVLDDVWLADVWVDLLRVPLYNSNNTVRVLITSRYENVAMDMKAAYIHPVAHLSPESSWDMLRRRLFSQGQEELENGLKELGLEIVKRCRGLPLAIKAIAGVLSSKPRTKKAWKFFLNDNAWSIYNLPRELSGALYLSFEDLPSYLKQCFLYFSLYPEDAWLDLHEFAQLWVAEGFITKQRDSLTENLAEECFNELLNRNLLLPKNDYGKCQMHDVIRSLAIFLCKDETSFGALNVKNSTTSIKLRRLSVVRQETTIEILNYVADKGALRTLLASYSDLLLDDERLRQLSHLRILDISNTQIQILPDSIGKLVHLRYLNLNVTHIRAIPESVEQLINLQFLKISYCRKLRQLPSGITALHNLRCLDIDETPISSIPKGIENLQQLNYLSGFVVANNDSSSKLEKLNSLKHIRILKIVNLNRPQSETIILKELSNLCTLTLKFSMESSNPSEEQELAVEELFDKIIPPQSLEDFTISGFFGLRFPNWMVSSPFEICVPNLTKLVLNGINSCTQLPSLGQLPELKDLRMYYVTKVKKIGPEFFGGDINLTGFAFPYLEKLQISHFPELEEWSFGLQVEQNANPKLKVLPCLKKLTISYCPLLKRLPKGLKYSKVKFLEIDGARSLKLDDNLPAEIEELSLSDCKNLEKICCAPKLKKLYVNETYVEEWEALSCVEKLDSLQELSFTNFAIESLPEWLLKLLQQWGLQNDSNDEFHLHLRCNKKVVQGCLKGGIYWDLIQHIPQVYVYGDEHHFRYRKQPYVYKHISN
ncbi:putative disease resistance protein RGA3 [Dendrobium catenatum]|uniref:Disease resistance protein RGA1 n=1 Tax=Dendrobium catenatum TaxID=906689 RepID=A0A2I0X4X9_9ASPA|nr:putative disease resistance protein RGA3 [Dendrobium catenatum]PKU82951.1 Putative disease resistance protein RGA1 [Dendrobium catenatum]